MAGGLGAAGGGGATVTAGAFARAVLIGIGIETGSDSEEKIFLPAPLYTTSSLCASLSRCSVGSMPALLSFCASGPAAVAAGAVAAVLTAGAICGIGRGV